MASVRVEWGGDVEELTSLVGKNFDVAVAAMRKRMVIPDEAAVSLNGATVTGSSTLKDGDVIRFVKNAGTKGC